MEGLIRYLNNCQKKSPRKLSANYFCACANFVTFIFIENTWTNKILLKIDIQWPLLPWFPSLAQVLRKTDHWSLGTRRSTIKFVAPKDCKNNKGNLIKRPLIHIARKRKKQREFFAIDFLKVAKIKQCIFFFLCRWKEISPFRLFIDFVRPPENRFADLNTQLKTFP